MVTTLLLVPPIKRLATVAGAVDEPNERKVHHTVVPRMGGLAMFFGFLVTYLVYFNHQSEFHGIFLGMVVIVVVGIIDDSVGLEPKLKFLGQVVAALAAIFVGGLNIDLVNMFGDHYSLGVLSLPLTIIWIVGITNAINLSDGLDGLASGISLIAFTCFGFLAYQRGDLMIFSVCLVLIGSILGFLKYNTHPAEVFMGDTGSMFLGFCLGTISIAGHFKSLTTMTLITPVLVLFVPICDTLWAIIRRLAEGRSPFSADKKHFHHRLLNNGMEHHHAVSVIYGISAALSISAVALANSSLFSLVVIPVLIAGVGLFFAQFFGMVDLRRFAAVVSRHIDQMFPFHLQSIMSRGSLKLIYLGVLLYILPFLVGLPSAPANVLFISATTIVLVSFLIISGGRNGQSYMIFSLFFLAAAIVLVVNHLLLVDYRFFGFSLQHIEILAFVLLVTGVFGKIIFKKTPEIILSTPLEFFIFLVLVSIAVIPEDIRREYYLVANTLRTFFLFLAFKIIVLASLRREPSSFSVVMSSLVSTVFPSKR